jgi:hypothetical protein
MQGTARTRVDERSTFTALTLLDSAGTRIEGPWQLTKGYGELRDAGLFVIKEDGTQVVPLGSVAFLES